MGNGLNKTMEDGASFLPCAFQCIVHLVRCHVLKLACAVVIHCSVPCCPLGVLFCSDRDMLMRTQTQTMVSNVSI
jgi:hypothetical protein